MVDPGGAIKSIQLHDISSFLLGGQCVDRCKIRSREFFLAYPATQPGMWEAAYLVVLQAVNIDPDTKQVFLSAVYDVDVFRNKPDEIRSCTERVNSLPVATSEIPREQKISPMTWSRTVSMLQETPTSCVCPDHDLSEPISTASIDTYEYIMITGLIQ